MKKIFLSFAALALVAVGTVSCGGDDSSPVTPTTDTPSTDNPSTDNPSTDNPVGTTNYIQVGNDKSNVEYSIYAVHVDGTGQDAPIHEYVIEGVTYAAFEFISHNGSAAGSTANADLTDITLLTKVNTDVEGDGRYSLPFTVENGTFYAGIVSVMNGTEYEFADGFTFTPETIEYATQSAVGAIKYVLQGADIDDATITLETKVDGDFDGLYSMNVASQAKGAGVKSMAKELKKANLTKYNGLKLK